jgi:hypothetical protein
VCGKKTYKKSGPDTKCNALHDRPRWAGGQVVKFGIAKNDQSSWKKDISAEYLDLLLPDDSS